MSRYPIIVEPLAKQDIREARDWLEQRKPGLSIQFKEELELTFDRISTNPSAQAVIERRTRQIRLPVLTYVVSYIFYESRVHVTAVLHGHRDPAEWRRRT